MQTRSLAAAILVVLGLFAAGTARTQEYDANCNVLPDSVALDVQEVNKFNPFTALMGKFAAKVCKPINAVSDFLSGKKSSGDEENLKPTHEELMEAARPVMTDAVPPEMSEHQRQLDIMHAREKEKSMADTMESMRLHSNPAEEAARAANESEEAGRLAFMPPTRPGGTAVIFARDVPQAPEEKNKEPDAPALTAEDAANLDDAQIDKAVEVQEKQDVDKESDADAPKSRADVEGKGVLISEDGIEAGDFHDGALQGQGEEIDPDGTWRGGEYQGGKLQGKGFEVGEEDGKQYARTGDFTNDEPDGEVKVTWQAGSSRKELWRGGYKVAEGPLAPPGQNPVLPERYLTMSPEKLAEATIASSDVLIDPHYVDGKLDGFVERIRADGSAQFEEWEDGHIVQLGVRGAKGDVIAPQLRPKPAPRVMASSAPPPQEPRMAENPDPCASERLQWAGHYHGADAATISALANKTSPSAMEPYIWDLQAAENLANRYRSQGVDPLRSPEFMREVAVIYQHAALLEDQGRRAWYVWVACMADFQANGSRISRHTASSNNSRPPDDAPRRDAPPPSPAPQASRRPSYTRTGSASPYLIHMGNDTFTEAEAALADRIVDVCRPDFEEWGTAVAEKVAGYSAHDSQTRDNGKSEIGSELYRLRTRLTATDAALAADLGLYDKAIAASGSITMSNHETILIQRFNKCAIGMMLRDRGR